MAKQYKIKRHRHYGGGHSFRAKPHPITVVLSVLAIAALVFAGFLVYDPLYRFLTADHSAGEVSLPEPEAEPESASAPEPEPEPEPEPAVVSDLRAVYLPTETALDAAALDAFLASLAGSEINAVMVDIKNAAGSVLFGTQNQNALQWGAVAENPLDLRALSAALEERELSLVVRMSAFRDPLAASAGRENAIFYRDTEMLWLDAAADAGGRPWLNPYAAGAREYVSALALEAADMGARMVVLENAQFPSYSESNAGFGPGSQDVTRSQILSLFIDELTAALRHKGARTAIYLPAISLTQESENVTRYGGSPLDIAGDCILLGALPYQFGGGYDTGGLTVEQPVANPGGATEAILAYTVEAYQRSGAEPPTILPLLQGGSEPDVNAAAPYTKVQVDAQIGAVKAAGLSEYFLYSTTGNYLLQ